MVTHQNAFQDIVKKSHTLPLCVQLITVVGALLLQIPQFPKPPRANFFLFAAIGAFQRQLPHQGEGRGGGRPAAHAQGGPEGPPTRAGGPALQRRQGGGELLAHRRRQGRHRPLGKGEAAVCATAGGLGGDGLIAQTPNCRCFFSD